MRARAAGLLAIALLGLLALRVEADEVVLRPAARVVQLDLPRYGLNLSGPSYWGAEQILSNVVANPGFEPVIDRALVSVASVAGRVVREDVPWHARKDGFWSGGGAEVLTGALAGQRFMIVDSFDRPGRGAELRLDRPADALAPGDVLAVSAPPAGGPPPQWWPEGRVTVEPGGPPHTTGSQAARLTASARQPAVLNSYFDLIGERAGRLLPVETPWKLVFWVRRAGDTPARLRVRFAREGGTLFIDQTVAPPGYWQRVEIPIRPQEGRHGKSSLSLTFSLSEGSVELDEVYLGEAEPGVGGFRHAAVETLRELRPGYLRDWQGQLGDSADNRFADPYSRRPVRYRAQEHERLHTYGVPELLELCAAIGATPWLILPTTLPLSEAEDFGRRLRAELERRKIGEALVEFGNENWNSIFAAAGITDPARHAEAAARALDAVRRGFGGNGPGAPRLLTLVNAQLVNAGNIEATVSRMQKTDRLAVAPYFAYELKVGDAFSTALAGAFSARQDAPLHAAQAAARRFGKQLAAYELNFHTTEGDAPAAPRNRLAAGAASGPALARQLLAGSLAGLREQAVYTFAGFDMKTAQGSEVRLFGITRDLAQAGRLRPSGHALQMLNAVAGGALSPADCRGAGCGALTVAVYGDGAAKRWAIVSGATTPMRVRLAGACRSGTPRATLLDGSDPHKNNEDAQTVHPQAHTVTCDGADARVVIPSYSLVTVGRGGS